MGSNKNATNNVKDEKVIINEWKNVIECQGIGQMIIYSYIYGIFY